MTKDRKPSIGLPVEDLLQIYRRSDLYKDAVIELRSSSIGGFIACKVMYGNETSKELGGTLLMLPEMYLKFEKIMRSAGCEVIYEKTLKQEYLEEKNARSKK